MNTFETDTICAIATGATNAGISIIRISGPKAFEIAENLFKSRVSEKKLSERRYHTLYLGNICWKGLIIDESLVSLMKAPNSYTGEDVAEINCHGGYVVTRKILEAVIESGARLAEPGEFTKRAFLNGRMDLSQAEAVIDIIHATNEAAVKNSVAQLSGKLKNIILEIRDNILRDTAFIEAALDDPEHIEIDGFADELLVHVKGNLERIDNLLNGFENGRLIRDGIKTVILGKPNAGKSTLLNTLTGTSRAIVTDIPGTTRDTLEELITIDGITLNIIDTAGIRETTDIVEKIGVDKALEEAKNADLCLYVADASREPDENDRQIIEYLKDRSKICILNKSDLKQILSVEKIADMCNISSTDVVQISAKDETGIDILIAKIKNMFGLGEIERKEDFYVSKLRHKELLEATKSSLINVINSIEDGMSEDFFSIDLLSAYKSLGEIIGEEIEDDLADRIFAEFCMGK